MTPTALAVIAVTIVFSSFLSGVFGLAGGMVLLGVLLVYFDVATAMILFSIIQFFANAWRAFQWWRFVRWRIFWLYVLGALVAFALMRLVSFVPDKALVYLALGLMPFLVEVVPVALRPNIEWRFVPFVTGALTTVIQFLAGVGGLFLDLFFQKSTLDRRTTLATKAVAQTFSHVLRGVYFGSFGLAGVELSVLPVLGAILLAIGGTALAPFMIERMSDHGFRQWTRAVIFTLAAVYVVRGGVLLWTGV
jgi:uncharacterized membrane protein YfcA